MYRKILIALDATDADETILAHVTALAQRFDSDVALLHVADGWAARLFRADAVSPEITQDKAYLEKVRARLAASGLRVEAELAFGKPADEIVKWVTQRGCELVAMSTHGHRFLADLIYGSTADKVRHNVDVPVLLLKTRK